jgi:hypothetical protein
MSFDLTPEQRVERQRVDQRLLAALDASDFPTEVSGHRSAEDVRASRNPVAVGDRVPPTHFRIVYDFDTLRAPGVRHRPTVVHVSPLANGGYPRSEPGAWVIGDVIPWTPHFTANQPICHGERMWIPNRTQLVDYVIHIGKLLNFDEPPPPPGYIGWNREAIEYWRDDLKHRPLDPDLHYPVIRIEDVVRPGAFKGGGDRPPDRARFRRAGGPSGERAQGGRRIVRVGGAS